MSEEKEEAEEKKKGGGNTLVIILLVLVVILLIAAIGIGVLLFLKMGSSSAEGDAKAAASHEAPAAHGEAGAGGESHAVQYSPEYKQYEPPPPDAEPLYFEFKPFVVGFKGEGKAKYLAVDIKVMSYYKQLVGGEKGGGDMEHLRPILRSAIISLLRKQTYTELSSDEGPDILRKKVLKTIREILKKHKIYPDLVEDVYLTKFVMQ